MAALIITPPAAAMRLAGSLGGTLIIAVLLAVACTLLGAWLAPVLHQETGPVVVAIAAAAFLASLLYRRQ